MCSIVQTRHNRAAPASSRTHRWVRRQAPCTPTSTPPWRRSSHRPPRCRSHLLSRRVIRASRTLAASLAPRMRPPAPRTVASSVSRSMARPARLRCRSAARRMGMRRRRRRHGRKLRHRHRHRHRPWHSARQAWAWAARAWAWAARGVAVRTGGMVAATAAATAWHPTSQMAAGTTARTALHPAVVVPTTATVCVTSTHLPAGCSSIAAARHTTASSTSTKVGTTVAHHSSSSTRGEGWGGMAECRRPNVGAPVAVAVVVVWRAACLASRRWPRASLVASTCRRSSAAAKSRRLSCWRRSRETCRTSSQVRCRLAVVHTTVPNAQRGAEGRWLAACVRVSRAG